MCLSCFMQNTFINLWTDVMNVLQGSCKFFTDAVDAQTVMKEQAHNSQGVETGVINYLEEQY